MAAYLCTTTFSLVESSPKMSPTKVLVFCLLLGIVVECIRQNLKFKKAYRFPTLVPGLPIVGNSFQMPVTGQGPFIQRLADKYGEMFTMKFGRTYWVFLNSSRVVMSVVFGRRSKLDDPELAELLGTAEEFVQYLIPGRALVDSMPFLTKIQWLKSWQPWRWYGDDLYRRTRHIYKREIDNLRQRQRQGIQKPCFMTELLDAGKDREFSEDELYFIAGALMEAGSDATRVALHEVVAGAALFPDWVERARVELDSVCGANGERLSDFSDIEHCPIIKGAVKESIRWKPSIPETGIPHLLIRDDEFEGYKFPAGTIFT
ncbi:uncharacterized protein Z518_03465 [Rhinocladiella mackenziei CBS 650.93]|uniref:Rhinocladiella mackenziei CBS 650.93 unplaced genomic scaffold supercont1.2, whole genome shotgun sequence n=1 Tax=Rhinocladiella mackenziei CBS 650.93 TaxID=1442369 RepID=A0A0D2HE13_9EURO|nr:uncharacterized protein Z518_03465 [Rhinocladiella mackenziei CBS 650.93]KIX08808.1 hypothetical protein Z518_03465 [Rhinocladiella mackenziei CBS 650.93]